MPAITVPDLLPLMAGIAVPEQATAAGRRVARIGDAVHVPGHEGEGFPVNRAFARLSHRDVDRFTTTDQMGEVDYAPGEPKGTPRSLTSAGQSAV